MSKVGEDCYFYIKASCRNGDNCTFRHCKDAILTQDTCKDWVSGRCHTLLCPKRHPQLSTTPICKFENSPTGCLNRNCSFRHVKSREPMKLPTALAEVLKKAAPSNVDLHSNGNQSSVVAHTNLKNHLNTPQPPMPHSVTRKPSPVPIAPLINPQTDPIPTSSPPHSNNKNVSYYKPKLKPITSEMETPVPIPTITLRSVSDAPVYHPNTSTALMSNLKVLTSHSDTGFYEKRSNALQDTNPVKKQTNSDPIKSPPSPITFQERPKRSPITFDSDTKVTHHTAITTVMESTVDSSKKRPRTLSRNNSNTNGPSQTLNSPLGEFPKPSVKRVKIRVRRNSSLLQVTPEEKSSSEPNTTKSPLLSPLDSGAYPSYSSDDFRIEDQIEDLINANFSPKQSQAEQDDLDEMPEIQDTDDIFLEFENLIS